MAERSSVGGALIDCVLFAGQELERLEAAFESLGFDPEYGGEHTHDATHNSLIGFEDGSYVELISTTTADVEAARRNAFIKNDVGPAGWALEVGDVDALADRVSDQGIPVRVSDTHERMAPNGDRAAWQLAYLGSGEPGTELPFLIEDRSPRERRITLTPGASETEVTGIGIVVVAVDDLEHAIQRYRTVFGLPEPERTDVGSFGGRVAYFPESAVALAKPLAGSWLDDRLESFGTLPCAVLLSVSDPDVAFDRFDVTETHRWFDRRVGWLPLDGLDGRIGLVGPSERR